MFEFDYEATDDGVGILDITHIGGDSVSRSVLYVRGSGCAEVGGANQTSAGSWQGDASSDEGNVIAGDRVTVGVQSDYEISVVWESLERDTSQVLGEHEGPDA